MTVQYCAKHGYLYDLHGACTKCRWRRPVVNDLFGPGLNPQAPRCGVVPVGGAPRALPAGHDGSHRGNDGSWAPGESGPPAVPACRRTLDAFGSRMPCRLELGHDGVCDYGPPTSVGSGCPFVLDDERSPAERLRDVTVDALVRQLGRRDQEIAHLHAQVTELQAAATKHVLERRNLLRETVRSWHEAMGIKDPATPMVPSDDVVRHRARLVAEEFLEFMVALLPSRRITWMNLAIELRGMISDSAPRVDLVPAMDAVADLLWVLEGTALAFGVDSGPLLAEVARSNHTKQPIGAASTKVTKGPRFSAPRLAEVLTAQGWRP